MSHTQASPATAPADAAPRCCGHHDAFAILHDCHEHILERLGRLERVGRQLERARMIEQRHLAELGDILAFLDTAVPIHSADEEQTLLPRLRAAVGPAAGAAPWEGLEREHLQHQGLLAELKRTVVRRDRPAAASAALAIVDEYRGHIAREEQLIFPLARQWLADPGVVQAMTQEMRQRRRTLDLSAC